MKPTVYLLILFWFVNLPLLMGQDDPCTAAKAKYKEADRAYAAGHIFLAKTMLKGIDNTSISKCLDVKTDISFLLSKLYLLTHEDTLAIKSYKKVLISNPSYKINAALEPTDMVYFANQYEAIPWFSFTPSVYVINIGISRRFSHSDDNMNSIEATSLNDTTIYTEFSGIPSFGGAISASFYPSKHWEISATLGFDEKKYEMTKTYYRYSTLNSTSEFILINEEQKWFTYAGTVKYNLNIGAINLAFFTGIQYNSLRNAYFTEARRDGLDLVQEVRKFNYYAPKEEIRNYYDALEERIDVKSIRNENLIPSWFLGTGIKIKPPSAKRHFFVFDMRYCTHRHSFTLNSEDILSSSNPLERDMVYALGYIEDPMRIIYIQFSLGYSHTFYRTIKNVSPAF